MDGHFFRGFLIDSAVYAGHTRLPSPTAPDIQQHMVASEAGVPVRRKAH